MQRKPTTPTGPSIPQKQTEDPKRWHEKRWNHTKTQRDERLMGWMKGQQGK